MRAPLSSPAFPGNTFMHHLVSTHAWENTALGPLDTWCSSMVSTVRILLSTNYPMVMIWGPEMIQIYNDAYSVLIGARHPAALGIDIKVTLNESWGVLEPLVYQALSGQPTWVPALPLQLIRAGYREEAYFSVSHSPAMDDEGRIAGMLAVCCEQTQSIIFAERMNVLRDVSMSATNTSSVDVALNGIATALAGRKTTVPFAIIYLADSNTEHLVLTKTIGLDTTANPNTAPARVKIGKDVKDDIWSLNVALASGLTEVTDVQNFAQVVGGPWDDLVHTAVVLPIRSSSHHDSKALGVMVGAVNPNKALDADYRSFYRLIASQVFIAVTNAKAHEEERKRAEMLLELDRQKQVFFSNVSHELRTPLTLSIAPLEQALSLPEPSIDAEGIRLIYRNASRLLRLVNTLLDFSRIETGTTSISFSAIDLSTVTAEMASSFQSLCDKAGIKLSVNAHPLSEAVWVSVNHWEKVVLNLLSNSFKYTLEGHIRVTVQPLTPEVQAELFSEIDGSTVTRYVAFSVADTGVGIPQKDIPLIFDRFHRVESSKGRSYEGTGIGLSLVREIVQFHSGFIAVRSLEGTGSTFTVVLPLGDSHIPPERKVDAGAIEILRGSASANQAVVAASQWLSDDLSTGGDGQSSAELSPRGVTDPIVEWLSISTIGNSCGYVLCVDDNRDMRSYLQTLLSPFCEVGSAANGRAALDSIQKRLPDLIISDIQMPEMDGKMLAKTLRSSKFRAKLSVIAAAGRKGDDHDTPVDPRWDYHALYVPIILLSARAGPEAIKDGLETGADDYICKPFHVPELVSRVKSQLAMSKTRRDWAAQMLAAQRKAIAAAEANSQFARQFLAIMSHEMRTPLNAVIGMTDLLLDTQLDAEQKEFVETVRSSGSHLQVIINETLDYSKIESGKLELEPHPVVIRQILEEAVDIVSSSASSNDLLFVWSIHPSTPNIVICDLARLKQVLINLLNNAAKFTAEGHVSVYIRYELDDQSGNTFGSPSPPSSETCHGTPEAHMRNTTPSGTLHISVKDTGFGISPRAQHRLFQPFSQIDSHATRVYGGTGLGLAVCKRLVQLMGGDIMCDSSGVPGEGATFRFWISAPPAPVHSLHDRMAAISLTDSSRITPPSSGITSDPLLHRPVPTLMGRRVLLIVPNGEANKIWARQLVVWGMSVVPVVAAGEAIRFLRHVAGKEPFDVIVMDESISTEDRQAVVARCTSTQPNGSPESLGTPRPPYPQLVLLLDRQAANARRHPLIDNRAYTSSELSYSFNSSSPPSIRESRPSSPATIPNMQILRKPVRAMALRDVLVHAVSMRPDGQSTMLPPDGAISETGSARSSLTSNVSFNTGRFKHNQNVARDHPLRILLAEDNPINRKVLLTMLSKLGYTENPADQPNPPPASVTVAFDGLAAVEIFERVYTSDVPASAPESRKDASAPGTAPPLRDPRPGFDIVLLDIRMPLMDGVAAASAIRRFWRPPRYNRSDLTATPVMSPGGFTLARFTWSLSSGDILPEDEEEDEFDIHQKEHLTDARRRWASLSFTDRKPPWLVAVTANAMEEEKGSYLKIFDSYAAKPLTIDAIINMLTTIPDAGAAADQVGSPF